jgi:U3 small nucleolar RNA-associated protein 10
MVLSALKGVGGILFEAEEVKSLFLYLLGRHSQHHSGHDSKQILSTHETQILCLLLEVNTLSCLYIYLKVLCILPAGLP